VSHQFAFRPGTQDKEVFHEVVVRNSYRLPVAFRGDEVIVDVGANIGAFAYAALVRGAAEVHAFEADRENCEVARQNLRQFGDRVKLHHAAVWRSDRREKLLHFDCPDRAATACGHVLGGTSDQTVRAEPLDALIRALTRRGRRIDLLKIDCEGSEYPILLTSRLLTRVDRIIGEFHNFASGVEEGHIFFAIPERARVRGYERFTDAELISYLRGRGFDVEVVRHEVIPHLLGVFDASLEAGRPSRLATFWKAWGRAASSRSA
jgi:FkbM family methyltransferase